MIHVTILTNCHCLVSGIASTVKHSSVLQSLLELLPCGTIFGSHVLWGLVKENILILQGHFNLITLCLDMKIAGEEKEAFFPSLLSKARG